MTRFPARPIPTWILAAGMLTALAVLATYSTGRHGIAGLQAPADHPAPLAIGAPAPDFSLPGIDGKTYSLASFKERKALVVIFTAVHCPTAEVYEGRIKKLVADYSAEGRRVRGDPAEQRQGAAARRDGLHRPRRLDRGHEGARRAPRVQLPVPLRRRDAGGRHEVRAGRDAARLRLRPGAHAALPGPHRQQPARGVRQGPDTRNALDAVLVGRRGRRSRRRRPSAARSSGSTSPSCTTPSRTRSRRSRCRSRRSTPPRLEGAAQERHAARRCLVNFWATWCAPCTAEFPDLQNTWRMYRKRPFELVTVSINYPDEEAAVRKFLEAQHATTRNLLSATMDPVRADEGVRSRLERRRAVLDGDRARRQGAVQGQRARSTC